MSLFNNFPYANSEEINLDYTLKKLNELYSRGENLYAELQAWKTETDEDNEAWKSDLLSDINEWQNSVTHSLDEWKTSVDSEVSNALTTLSNQITAELAQAKTALRNEVADLASAAAASAADAAASQSAAAQSAQSAINSAAAAAQSEQNITESAEQIETNKNDITDLNSAFKNDLYTATGNKSIEYVSGYYININGTTANVNNPTVSAKYGYALIPCVEGDLFTVNAKATSSEVVWGFVSFNGGVLKKSNIGPITIENVVVTAPVNSAYLVINTTEKAKKSYYGKFLKDIVAENFAELRNVESYVESVQADVNETIDDVYRYTGNKKIEFTRGAYIYLAANTELTLTPRASSSYEYAIVECSEGDIFTISGTGTAGAGGERLYGFVNDENVIVSMASTAMTVDKQQITAPAGAVKLIINNSDFNARSYRGAFLVDDLDRRINLTRRRNDTDTEKYWEIFDWTSANNRTVTTGQINYDYVADNYRSYKITQDDSATFDVRFSLPTGINTSLTGINAIRVLFYTPDISKFNIIGIEIIGTSYTRTVGASSLKNGWNTITVYSVDGNITTWDSVHTIRLYATGTAGRVMYVAKISLYRPPVGNIIFIEDGGYQAFLNNGYNDLKAIEVPTTWAIDPADIGTGSRITQEQVEALSGDGMSEFSFHAWTSSAPTATMTAQELRDETMKCLTYLRKNGLLPKYIWRAAFTQNNAPQYMALVNYLDAMATATSNSYPTSFPFPNKYNIPRIALHNASQNDIDTIFSRCKKTHCTYLLYTHGIGSGGTYDMTQENWDYFITQLSAAIQEGYVRGTTYNQLMMENERTASN